MIFFNSRLNFDEDSEDSFETVQNRTHYFHQIFGAVSYDTIKLKGSSTFASNIGLYFSHMFDGGAKVDKGTPGFKC